MKAVQALQDKPKNKDRDIVTSGRFAFLWESGFARDFPVFFSRGDGWLPFLFGKNMCCGSIIFPVFGRSCIFFSPLFFFPWVENTRPCWATGSFSRFSDFLGSKGMVAPSKV